MHNLDWLRKISMKITLHLDDIIYQLQKGGGASNYWREVTTRCTSNSIFNIRRTKGSKLTRFLPVPSTADLFHSSHFRIPLSTKTKHIATVYDFIYELGWLKTKGSALNIFQRKQSINRADAIICISQNTKKDLLALYPDLTTHPHIYAVPLGTSLRVNSIQNTAMSIRLTELIKLVQSRYILFVGTRTHYKNFSCALQGFAESSLPRSKYSFICTGPSFTEADHALVQKFGIQDKVFLLEFATTDELIGLYKNALALVYPSFYEGFGLPLLEAINCGCPTIAANTSSLPEVVGDAGILIDPKDAGTISTALEQLLDPATREEYRKQGFVQAASFSWEKTAQKHIEIYKAVGSV